MFLNAGKLKKTVEDGTQGKGKGKVVGIETNAGDADSPLVECVINDSI